MNTLRKAAGGLASSPGRAPIPASVELAIAVPIADLAREFGLSMRALRYYEDRGLLSPVRSGVMRVYDATQRRRLATIMRGRQLGFTLGEIRALLAKGTDAPDEAGLLLSRDRLDEQISRLERQREEVVRSLEQLRALRLGAAA